MAQFLPQVYGTEYTTDSIIAALNDVIQKYSTAHGQMKEILKDVQSLERGVNISRTVSTTANTVGQALMFTPEFPLGIALLIGGGLLSLGTYLTDKSVTKKNLDELVQSLKSAEGSMENLQPSLVYLHTLGNGLGFSISQRTEDTIYSLLDRRVVSAISGEIGAKVPPLWTKIEQAQEAAKAAKAARTAEILRRMDAVRTYNAVDAVNAFWCVDAAGKVDAVRTLDAAVKSGDAARAAKVAEAARLREYYAGISNSGYSAVSTAGAEVPSQAMGAVGQAFAVAGVVVDIGSTVYGWAYKHPPVERVEKEIENVERLLNHLTVLVKGLGG